ncbi:MAG: HAD family hydrolase [Chloroflexi bacterium]|nr:HAD family hydrolase [Chloroflexota bacterium]
MSKTIAFFDLDRTILTDSSGLLYMRYLWRRGDVSRWGMLRAYGYSALYKLGFFNYPAVAAKLASTVSDDREEETRAFCQQWFEEMVVKYVAPKAIQRMDKHRAQGHAVTIISASTPYVVGPVAAHLGIEEYLCTRLEVVEGHFTGRIVEPACYGPGKIHWAGAYAREHGADLGHAYFYTDSHSDAPLLERVGHPVAVNPDSRLKALAARRGWSVEYFY